MNGREVRRVVLIGNLADVISRLRLSAESRYGVCLVRGAWTSSCFVQIAIFMGGGGAGNS